MKSIYLLIVSLLLSNTISFAQIKQSKTNTVKIYGNCEMCKTSIENAGNKKNESKINWDEHTQTASIEYNPEKTTLNDVLKRVALAGYDNENFLAPDPTYKSLPSCCQYDRPSQPTSNTSNHEKNRQHMNMAQDESPLALIFNSYFLLKEALVSSDYNQAKSEANNLIVAIEKIDMTDLSNEEHIIWMKTKDNLLSNTKKITSVKDISKQRDAFSLLSEDLYTLIKVTKLNRTIYYAHCPMFNNGKGANWLSLQEQIKKPYFGANMLTCGNNTDIIVGQ